MTTDEIRALADKLEAFRPAYGWPEETATTVQPAMNVVAATALRDLSAKLAKAVEALRGVCEAWEWWDVDRHDRCSSVPGDAVREARAALAEIEESHD